VYIGVPLALAATLRDSAGAVLSGRVITWESGNAAVAAVSASGLVTGVAAGVAGVVATSEGRSDTAHLTVVPLPLPDPSWLPVASGQHPAPGSYGRALAAGQTYVDPNANTTVLKLTDTATPIANAGMYPGYSEGGPNISQPWTGTDGEIYYTAKVGQWLVDIRHSTMTPVNWRQILYQGEIGFAFSLNPATPRIAYIVTDWIAKRVERYNTATNQIENTGRWPWIPAADGQYLTWLQTNLNDEWFVAMLSSNSTVVAFRPSDGLERTITEEAAGLSIDEPHLDREFPYVYLSTNSVEPNKIVSLETGAFTDPVDPDSINGDDHAAPLRGKIVALVWMVPGIVSVDYQGNVQRAVTPSPTDWDGDWHMAGQWVFNNPNEYFVIDQWAGEGEFPINHGMIGFVSTGGDVRIIAASDAIGTDYSTGGQPHPTLAPDGKLVMWVSNMNGSGRYDTFIARIPVK
jgi:hypothetical protein